MEKTLEKVKIASIHDLPEKMGKTVRIGELELAVFKLGNGKVTAIENRCPHKGGVLAEGIVSGEHVFCPMHDWKICTTDGKVQAPDEGCVSSYKAVIENDDVYLYL
ncbi:nitrite reductase small subunit NirD [Domibacillus enclensis]|uniref:Nitrite reductase (NAD(P)H) small subunit n=1 Tax=Domibacillus enclensis TaxID=1017273 RepID=A0A1N6SU17_9BACI|nr:nitrite reductase small subunit NirD [Domibacillus enclensis]OXS79420.1 nitrite reductase (NAD(P)H) small subunit [Domibacillus enclensis]SIQ44635.1 nitrite reductase (NADH) small subunit [Domibacillus enclensis]